MCVVTPAPGACTAQSFYLHQVPVRSKAGERWGGPQSPQSGVGQGFSCSHPHRHTSKAADVVLLGGDLNMHPEDVGIRLLRGWTGLQDAFAEAKHFEVSSRVEAGSWGALRAPHPPKGFISGL